MEAFILIVLIPLIIPMLGMIVVIEIQRRIDMRAAMLRSSRDA